MRVTYFFDSRSPGGNKLLVFGVVASTGRVKLLAVQLIVPLFNIDSLDVCSIRPSKEALRPLGFSLNGSIDILCTKCFTKHVWNLSD